MTGWLLDRPRLAALILAALILLPLAALPRLTFDNSPETYLPATAPGVVFTQQLRAQFPEDQVLLALFGGPTLWAPATLQRLDALGETLEQSPLIERVLRITRADHIESTDDGFRVGPVVDLQSKPRSADDWRRAALSDPFAPGLLVAQDGSALALIVRPHTLHDSRQRLQVEQTVRTAIQAAGLDPLLMAVGGPVALDVAQLHSMQRDAATFTPLTTALGLGLLWWMFRRWLVVVMAGLTFAATTAGAVAVLALAGRPFTLVDSMLPPLLLALGTAALMHLFSGVAYAGQGHGSARDRVHDAIGHVRQPALFAAMTTIAGLLSLAATPIRPIADFGIAGAVGVALIYFVTIWLLPPLIVRFDRCPWRLRELGLHQLNGLVRFTTRLALRRPAWVLGSFAALLIVGLPQLANIRVQTDLYRFFSEGHALTRATHTIEDHVGGVTVMELVFDAADRDGLVDPAALAALADVQRWLRQQPEVTYTLSLADLVTEMHRAFTADPNASLPTRRDLVSQYLLIYDGRDLHDLVDRDYQRTRLLLKLNSRGSAELNDFMRRVRARLAAQPPGDLRWDLAGSGRLFADQERLLMGGQISSGLAVLAMVFGLLALMWRSLRAAAICMLPNAAPVILTFVLMGTLGVWLDMATALIASVATGIAVDDTIYLYQGYRRRRTAGIGVAHALARTLRRTGPDCVATSTVLGLQFVLLGLSPFIPTREFGLLTGFGLLVAVTFDLLLLPALLMWVDRARAAAR